MIVILAILYHVVLFIVLYYVISEAVRNGIISSYRSGGFKSAVRDAIREADGYEKKDMKPTDNITQSGMEINKVICKNCGSNIDMDFVKCPVCGEGVG